MSITYGYSESRLVGMQNRVNRWNISIFTFVASNRLHFASGYKADLQHIIDQAVDRLANHRIRLTLASNLTHNGDLPFPCRYFILISQSVISLASKLFQVAGIVVVHYRPRSWRGAINFMLLPSGSITRSLFSKRPTWISDNIHYRLRPLGFQEAQVPGQHQIKSCLLCFA